MKILNSLNNFSDSHGNSLVASPSATALKTTIIFNEIGASLVIGENVKLNNCRIILGRNAQISIGDNCILSGLISCGAYSKIILENGVTVTSNVILRAVEKTNIEIGKDGMIASNVVIRTNDGHPIYDIHTKKRINMSRSIKIEEHVWLGDESLVLKGVVIEKGSIIAARAVVTKNIPNNCLAGGIPASILKKDVTWERDINKASHQYYQKTINSEA